MKQIIAILLLLPFAVKAQVPTLNADTTYRAKALKSGVLVVDRNVYFPNYASTDTTFFAQFDSFGKLVLRKANTAGRTFSLLQAPDSTKAIFVQSDNSKDTIVFLGTTGISGGGGGGGTTYTGQAPIVVTGSVISADTSKAQGSLATFNDNSLKQNLVTLTTNGTGILPTFDQNTGLLNISNVKFNQTSVPFANAAGLLTSDSSKLNFDASGNALNINFNTPGSVATSSFTMNYSRFTTYANFNGVIFNVGSGNAGNGTYDASKSIRFQNRGNNYLQFSSSAISNPTNVANFFNTRIQTTNTIQTGGYTVATLPAGVVGMMAYVTDGLKPTYLATVVGGGTVKCPVFFDGTGWKFH